MGYRALSNWIIGLAVLVFAAVTGVQTLLGKEQLRLVPASSRVAPVPTLELMDRPYFTALSDWSADNFWTRGPLTALNGAIQYFGFNSTSDDRVLPGKDGWLFFGDSAHIGLLSGEVDLTEYTDYLSELLSERRNWLNERGSDYVYMIGPAAHSIYPDKLPWRSPEIRIPTPAEKMAAEINATHEGLIVAPYERLRAAREGEAHIYHKNDSHWTQAGAAIALNEVLERFGYDSLEWEFRDVPNTPGAFGRLMGVPITQFGAAVYAVNQSSPTKENADDYCKALGRDAVRRCVLYKQSGRTGRALVLGDSFGNYMQPSVVRAFGETLVLNLWEAPPEPERRFPVEVIEAFEPDIVIELTAEYRAQPCSPTQLAGCSGYFGVANPFSSTATERPVSVFEGDFEASYDLTEFASERSSFTSGAIRLDGLEVGRRERLFVEVSVPESFNGRILGGVPNKVASWVNTDRMIVRSSDAGFENPFVIEVSPEPTGADRFIRFATEGPSTGTITVKVVKDAGIE